MRRSTNRFIQQTLHKNPSIRNWRRVGSPTRRFDRVIRARLNAPVRTSSGCLQEKVRGAIRQLLGLGAGGDELDALDDPSQARSLLVGVEDSDERPSRLRPLRRNPEEILVLSEQEPAELRRPGEEGIVVP